MNICICVYIYIHIWWGDPYTYSVVSFPNKMLSLGFPIFYDCHAIFPVTQASIFHTCLIQSHIKITDFVSVTFAPSQWETNNQRSVLIFSCLGYCNTFPTFILCSLEFIHSCWIPVLSTGREMRPSSCLKIHFLLSHYIFLVAKHG